MKITRILFAFLAIALAVSAFAQLATPTPEEAPEVVPMHVMLFALHDNGVVEPDMWRTGSWSDLHPATDAEIDEAINEPDSVRDTRKSGRIAVRALDGTGRVIYQTIVTVPLMEHMSDWNGGTYRKLDDPLFTVGVPRKATLVRFEGWQPATHSTFNLEQIAARYGHDRIRANGVAPQQTAPLLSRKSNRINILILGDGYTAADQQQFNTQVTNFTSQLFVTEPYRRYSAYYAVQSAFQPSGVQGAYHPPNCPPLPNVGPQSIPQIQAAANQRNTLMHGYYCADLQNVRGTAINYNDAQRQRALAMDSEPDILVVLINDPQWGGGGGTYPTASADPRSPLIVIHELGHASGYTDLADEYTQGSFGFPACTEPACKFNVTTAFDALTRSRSSLKWSRWVDSDPAPTCVANNGDAQQCSIRAIGAYEGATLLRTGVWRSEFDCLMRNAMFTPPQNLFDQPQFCHVCAEKHIRALYQRVSPILSVFGAELLATGSVPHVAVGSTQTLGVSTLDVSTDPKFKYTWRVDGTVVPTEIGSTFNYTPTTASTHRVELDVEDITPMLRVDAANPKPRNMNRSGQNGFAWTIIADASCVATSSGTQPVVRTTSLTVPAGTQFLDLNYTLLTSEPGSGGRPGDQWSVTVSYSGTTATALGLTAAENLFHADGTILGTNENGTKTAPAIPIATSSGPVTVVVEVTVKNLETADFIPTTISALLSARPTACGTNCDFCAAHPDDPSCPVKLAISSAKVIPNGPSFADQGDSSYFSLGERLDKGWHVELKMTVPNTYKSLRMTATAIRPRDNAALMVVRDTTDLSGFGTGFLGFEKQPGAPGGTYDFNISPKKDFAADAANLLQLPESEWTHELKFRITATATMADGRVGIATIDVDNVISSTSSTDPVIIPRPLHALWHSSKSGARWHFWSSLAYDSLLRSTALALRMPDRIADEHAVSDTPYGHQYGTGITEPQFYPGAGRYDHGDYSHYVAFRTTANQALNGAANVTPAQQQAARDTLVKWITDLRSHLEVILPDNFTSEVRVGDGGWCSNLTKPSNDKLPDDWMKTLLLGGVIADANGALMLDLTNRVPGTWQPQHFERLSFSCIENFHINLLVDRCKIGEVRGPCQTGRPPGLRVFIRTAPQSQTINPGQSAQLSVDAGGSDLHFQWYAGSTYTYDSPISGATGTQISVTPPISTNYWVLVTGAEGVAAAGATITVNGTGAPCTAPPAITQNLPVERITFPGQSVSLSIIATGDGLRYQWYTRDLNGNPVALTGQTSATFNASDQGLYFVRVSNNCGSVDSTPTTVIIGSNCVSPGPNTISVSNTSIKLGESIELSIVPTGKAPVTVLWYEFLPDGSVNSLAFGTNITVTPLFDQTYYFAGLSNECGSRFTEATAIHVCTPPAIRTQPVAPVFSAFGQSTELVIEATGSDLHYTWLAGGAQLNNDSPRLLIGAPPAPVNYVCIVSNDCGSVTSSNVTVLPPCNPPAMQTQPANGSLVQGASIDLTASAFGTQPLSYQWSAKTPADSAFADLPGQTTQTITVTPTVDQTQYRVHIANACGAVDSNPATITVTAPCDKPVITTSPFSRTVAVDAHVALRVVATGTAPLSYQWYQDGAPIDGATNSIYSFDADVTTQFRVVVTNACGSAEATATITVGSECLPPNVSVAPQSKTINAGEPATLTVQAGGTAPLAYQWFTVVNGVPFTIDGETSSSINVAPSSTTQYRVQITNSCGSTTADATITVAQACTAPEITQQPQPSTINPGQSATLSVNASGSAPLTFEWFTTNGLFISTGASIDVNPAVSTSYYARVTNACGQATSNVTTVNVMAGCTQPSIAQQPQDRSVSSGTQVTLSVTANGSSPLQYQWYVVINGDIAGAQPIMGQLQSTFTTTPTTSQVYYVLVWNSCGSLRSRLVTVNVNTSSCTAPAITQQPQSQTSSSPITLSVTATGTAPLSYQWYYASTRQPVVGKTSSSFQNAGAEAYYVVVSNACGQVESLPATATYCSAPTLLGEPNDRTITQGQTITLGVTAFSPTPQTFQWYDGNGQPIAGQTSDALTVTPQATTSYFVRVTNSCGTSESHHAIITVSCAAPSITSQPHDASITAGQSATLSLTATGSAPLDITWYADMIPVGSGTSINVSPSTTTTYVAMVSNACGSAGSDVATVTVAPACNAPQINEQPQSATIDLGQSVTLHVGVTGTAPITITWTREDSQGAGSGDTLVVSPGTTHTYTATATNACGTAVSDSATITVNRPGGGGDDGGPPVQ